MGTATVVRPGKSISFANDPNVESLGLNRRLFFCRQLTRDHTLFTINRLPCNF
jgi:hypothetical protein